MWCTVLTYLHEKEPHNEGGPLAVAHLTVMEGVRLHHVKEAFLAQPILFLKEVMFRICAGNVSPDDLRRIMHCLNLYIVSDDLFYATTR